MRAAVEVRPVEQDDMIDVARLAERAAEESPSAVQGAPSDASRLLEHLSVLLGAGGQVLVARHEGEICGFAVLRVIDPLLFATSTSLYVDAVFVSPSARRRGVGHALLAAAAAVAGERGAENVYCAPAPGARGMHRFLARLGFAPTSGHRVVATATLQRRLVQENPRATRTAVRVGRREATRAAIEDLVARRRRARAAGLPTGPVDLRAFQAERDAALRAAAERTAERDDVVDGDDVTALGVVPRRDAASESIPS
ncbi:N-acetyltransferase family protein [Isoptericola variabilis]|uniref:GNAT family N-acetyltransferase n=1 Tax=Isoptericola variabilis TaxID=139208 RepID=UPI003D20C888